MTAQPCIIAVPSILIVAPKGMVKDDTSRETPISLSFSIFSGIVAFDVDDENAKNITEINRLKNLSGFKRVNIIIIDGYTINACIAKPKSTHPMYLSKGISPSKPRPAKVFAIKQNTPIGANFITMEVISIMIVFPSTKNLLTVCVSSFNLANIKPTSTPKIITGSISPEARELIGLSGMMFITVSAMDCAVVRFACARPAIFKPSPGLMIPAIRSAIVIANAVVKR